MPIYGDIFNKFGEYWSAKPLKQEVPNLGKFEEKKNFQKWTNGSALRKHRNNIGPAPDNFEIMNDQIIDQPKFDESRNLIAEDSSQIESGIFPKKFEPKQKLGKRKQDKFNYEIEQDA